MKYFAYGSNMNPERMKQRQVSFTVRVHAILRCFTLEFNKVSSENPREGKANVTHRENELVEGALYEISESDLEKLDDAEGWPRHYGRIVVKVHTDNRREVDAITYVAQSDRTKKGLKPTQVYLANLLAANDILSHAYYAKLESVETLD